MKVTVCFGDVRVVVPCRGGQLTIGELTELAIARYKKAVSKLQDVWVLVHNLKSSDGGILDPDDRVMDVVDDKEQIFANFDMNCPSLHPNNGDGKSSSSIGTSSPDVFRWGKSNHGNLPDWQRLEDTKESSVTVRRGSDPAMEVIRVDSSPKRPFGLTLNTGFSKSNKDQPVFQQTNGELGLQQTDITNGATDVINEPEESPGNSFNEDTFRAFMRTASRKSLNNGTAMRQWLEAQERVQNGYIRIAREEPIGSSDEAEIIDYEMRTDNECCAGTLVEIDNPGCALGIHVAPSLDENGRNLGLEITFIEPGGFIESDQRLRLHDCIIEVNGISLLGLNFSRAQEVFRDALKAETVSLRIQAPSPQPLSSSVFRDDALESAVPEPDLGNDKTSKAAEAEDKVDLLKNQIPETPVVPKQKIPPVPPVRHPATALTTKAKFTPILNTRIIGQKLEISLTKGDSGLGFSVTTRDNPASDDCPIYIKNILPHGAAIVDGRLRSGDRLLEVNGTSMSGKTQTNAVNILRSVKVGGTVNLLVSRQTDDQLSESYGDLVAGQEDEHLESDRPAHDQALIENTASQNPESLVPDAVTILRLKISGTGQESDLGIGIKGQSETDGRDLGVFVKSISKDGAAAQDGRLKPDDQILEVNGISLVGMSYDEATNLFYDAVKSDASRGVYLTLSRMAVENDIRDLPDSSKSQFLMRDMKETSGGVHQNPPSGKHVQSNSQGFVDSKVWRNISYQLANSNSIVTEGDDDDGSVFENQDPRQQSCYDSGLHSGSASESEFTKRTSITAGSADCESSNQSQPSTFDRDGPGRRSMSEKRRAFVDPKSSIFYRKLKEGKGHREVATLTRSNSVESLMSQSQATQKLNDFESQQRSRRDNQPKRSNSMKNTEEVNRRSSGEVFPTQPLSLAAAKCRTWNESFRAAIDRCYVNPVDIDVSASVHKESSSQGSTYWPNQVRREANGKGVPYRPALRNPETISRLSNVLPVPIPEQRHLTPVQDYMQTYITARWQQPPGSEEHHGNNLNNVQAKKIGYHGYLDTKSARHVQDLYARANMNYTNPGIADSRSNVSSYSVNQANLRTNIESSNQYQPHFGPSFGSQPYVNPCSNSNEPVGNSKAPTRTRVIHPDRSGQLCQRNSFYDRSMLTEGQSNCHPNTCDSFPNLTSVPNSYLSDLTNITKSSQDLSSFAGLSRGVRGIPPAWTDLPLALTEGNGSLNRRKGEAQRKPGFVISGGAFV